MVNELNYGVDRAVIRNDMIGMKNNVIFLQVFIFLTAGMVGYVFVDTIRTGDLLWSVFFSVMFILMGVVSIRLYRVMLDFAFCLGRSREAIEIREMLNTKVKK